MAKKKSRKKNTEKFESEVLVYVYALILISISIIGILKLGFLGQFLSRLASYLLGSYSIVVYGVFLVYALFVMFTKKKYPFSMKKSFGIISLLLALIIWSAIPVDDSLVGFKVIQTYLANTVSIFSSDASIAFQGGIVGALLYSITSVLFAKQGTFVIIVSLIVLSIILNVDASFYKRTIGMIRQSFANSIDSHTERKEKKQEVKKEKLLQRQISEDLEKETLKKSVFVDVENVEIQKKSSFITNDEINMPISDLTGNDNDNDSVIQNIIKADAQNINLKDDNTSIGFNNNPNSNNNLNTANLSGDPIADLPNIESKVDNSKSKVFKVGMNYRLPPLSLLDNTAVKNKSNANQIAANTKAKRLIEVLANFSISAQLIAIHIGPAVTKFEIKPDSSVKVSKISNISDNLKMELAARDIRIEAPIPGRNAVGIEIPNVETTMVKMFELAKVLPFDKKERKLTFILGKDLMGRAVYCDLAKMPHLLIAGATGSGKSVCMNTIITSFLLRNRPDEVKLLLVDPKKVEFTPYHNVPHLIGPVISDAQEAARALKVVVQMMEDRYTIFADTKVRNIETYNQKIKDFPDEKLTSMPYIVVVIDELADLMAVAGKDVETSIQRITQLARAAGIHLIVATQRPSTDVITGIIKANIPSRIAFAVSSGIDSRTILDSIGAERLLGFGDMLYLPIGEPSAIRLQGVYLSDEEVSNITDFVSKQAKPFYEDAFIRLEGVDNNEATSVIEAKNDPLYDEVKEYVIDVQKASTSLLQRRFGLGYNRAARMIDVLEDRGIVGPAQGSKPRDVYIKKES